MGDPFQTGRQRPPDGPDASGSGGKRLPGFSAELGQKLPIKGPCGANKPRRRKKEKLGLTFPPTYATILELLEAASEYPGVAKFGIALEWGSRGRWFESSHSDQISAGF